MISKIVLFATLLAYSFIVSQSFMYILSLKNVQLNMDASAYTLFRKSIDTAMQSNFKYVIYAALLTNLLLIASTVKMPSGFLFVAAVISFAALVTDVVITLKGSLPVNDVINAWPADDIPANWTEVRSRWLQIFQYRQISNTIGFISLLAAAVFGSK